MTATAVLLPTAAWADGPGDVACTVQGTLDAATGTTPTCTSAPAAPAAAAVAGDDAATGDGSSTSSSSSSPSLPPLPPLDPSQLNALLAQAGISTECSTAVEGDLSQTIADIPATAEQLLQQILDQLGQGGGGLPVTLTDPASGEKVVMTLTQQGSTTVPHLTSTDPSELALVKDLQQLLTDLLTKCLPAPTSTPTSTTSAPTTTEAPQSTQPVTYLGYAPTGGSGPSGGSGSAPLAVLGGGLLLAGGAGATWYGVRSRAARAKG